MNCFSLGWLESFLVQVVIVCVVVGVIRIVVPWALTMLGADGVLGRVVNLILWGIVTVVCIYIIFGLLSCLLGGGLHMPRVGSFEDIGKLV